MVSNFCLEGGYDSFTDLLWGKSVGDAEYLSTALNV